MTKDTLKVAVPDDEYLARIPYNYAQLWRVGPRLSKLTWVAAWPANSQAEGTVLPLLCI